MLIVLSPAKSLDYETAPSTDLYTQPAFIERSAQLIVQLRTLAPAQLASLMHISDPLAALNAARYASWSPQFSTDNAKQALLAFNGDVYAGLHAASLNATQLAYAQAHIRILSGLYGVLRPLDLMQPYRLEMGTRLPNLAGPDLYAFWGDAITDALNQAVIGQRSKTLVNLASAEYFKAVRAKVLHMPVVTPVFQDWSAGKYKIISFYAKRARGLMARYAALHGIETPEQLKAFDLDGYAYAPEVSDDKAWVFRRGV